MRLKKSFVYGLWHLGLLKFILTDIKKHMSWGKAIFFLAEMGVQMAAWAATGMVAFVTELGLGVWAAVELEHSITNLKQLIDEKNA